MEDGSRVELTKSNVRPKLKSSKVRKMGRESAPKTQRKAINFVTLESAKNRKDTIKTLSIGFVRRNGLLKRNHRWKANWRSDRENAFNFSNTKAALEISSEIFVLRSLSAHL